jgi:hypothetical protein
MLKAPASTSQRASSRGLEVQLDRAAFPRLQVHSPERGQARTEVVRVPVAPGSAATVAVDQVVAGHSGPWLTVLDRALEGDEVRLAVSSLLDARLGHHPAGLMRIQGEVLHRGHHTLGLDGFGITSLDSSLMCWTRCKRRDNRFGLSAPSLL